MKRIFFFSIALWFIGLNSFNPCLSYAKDISESEVKKAEQEAKLKVLESKQLQAQAIQLNLELSKINKNSISLAQQIQNNEEALSKLEGKLKDLQKNLSVKEKAFKKENDSLVHVIASLQNMSLNPSESVILQPLSPVDIIRSAILLRETVPYLSQKSSLLKVDLESIYEQKHKIEANLAETQKKKQLLSNQQSEMKDLLKKKTLLRTDVENKSAETQKIAADLSSKAQNLRDLLEELERQKEIARKKQEEAARRAAAERAKQQQSTTASPAKTVSSKTHATIKKQISGGKFAQAKGQLTRPVRGAVITEYGQLISKGVTSKGLVYKARPKAQVVAPYEGTVIFSGPFKGYGNIIIVEHGGGYLSLLAGLGHIDCEVGQTLQKGEPVGTMPNDDKAKLYVEIRKDRHPINPSPWIAG
jgi:septal ring factor EnvC (AmiA/AmiB activator)